MQVEIVTEFTNKLASTYSQKDDKNVSVWNPEGKPFDQWLEEDGTAIIWGDPYMKARADYFAANPPGWLAEGDADGSGQSDGWGEWDYSGSDSVAQPSIFEFGQGAAAIIAKQLVSAVWKYIRDNPTEAPPTPTPTPPCLVPGPGNNWCASTQGGANSGFAGMASSSTWMTKGDDAPSLAPPRPGVVSGVSCKPLDCYAQCRLKDAEKLRQCKTENDKHVEKMKQMGCKGTRCSTKSFSKSCRKKKAPCKRKKSC